MNSERFFYSGWEHAVLDLAKVPGISPLLGTDGDFAWGGAKGTNFWVDSREQLAVVFMAPLGIRIRRIREQDGVDEMQAVRRLKRKDQDSRGLKGFDI